MERSLYPDRVLVGTEALSFTESSKINAVLTRFQDTAGFGVVSGLVVAAATNPTQLAVLGGRGYTSSGEEVVLPTSISAINPASTATGIANANYVCLVYTEDDTRPEAHATLNQTVPTRALGSYRAQVFLLAELEALLSSSTNMAVNAQDRVLICAVATAGTTGNFNSNGAVIVNAPFGDAVTGVVQPVLGCSYVGNQRIVGTVVHSVDPATPTTLTELQAGSIHTQGIIVFTPQAALASIGTATLSYQAPGAATAGSTVAVSTIPTASWAVPYPVTLTSAGGRVLVLDVVVDMLPNDPGGSSSNYTDTLNVINVYTETAAAGVVVPRAGAVDVYHRHLVGTGAPTPTNPHGLRINDLATETADFSQGIIVGSGLLSTDAQALTPRVLVQQSGFGAGRTLLWDTPFAAGSPPAHIRIFASSGGALEVTINCTWSPSTSRWVADNTAFTSSKWMMTSSMVQALGQVPGPANWTDALGAGGWAASALEGDSSTAPGVLHAFGQLVAGEEALGAGQLTTARVSLPALSNGGNDVRTLLMESLFSGGVAARIYRAAADSTSGDVNPLEFTLNASWSATSGRWSGAASRAMKLALTPNGFHVYGVSDASSAFLDNAWTQKLDYDALTGNITSGGGLSLGGSLALTGNLQVGGSTILIGPIVLDNNVTVTGSTGITLTNSGANILFTAPRAGSVTITPAGISYPNTTFNNLFEGTNNGGETDGSVKVTQYNGGGIQYQFRVPHGATLTTGRTLLRESGGGGGTVTGNINFYSISKSSQTRTSIGSIPFSVTDPNPPAPFTATLSGTADNTNNLYQVEIVPSGSGFQIYWFEVNYTVTQLAVF